MTTLKGNRLNYLSRARTAFSTITSRHTIPLPSEPTHPPPSSMMSVSRMSSEPLSTPSSTPSPPPPRTKGSATHTNNRQAIPPHGLNSDSELSELTEEEQESAEKRDHASNGPDGDSMTAGDEESGGTSGATSTSASKRGANKPRGKRVGGRKKRSSLVPAPMWGWAEVRTSNVREEEEEEELSAQPKALEEEEDEEEGEGKKACRTDDAIDVSTSQAGPSAVNGTEREEAESDTEEDNKRVRNIQVRLVVLLELILQNSLNPIQIQCLLPDTPEDLVPFLLEQKCLAIATQQGPGTFLECM